MRDGRTNPRLRHNAPVPANQLVLEVRDASGRIQARDDQQSVLVERVEHDRRLEWKRDPVVTLDDDVLELAIGQGKR
ncbi:MAG: hypothetical protein ACK55I_36770, partial [bacterium]